MTTACAAFMKTAFALLPFLYLSTESPKPSKDQTQIGQLQSMTSTMISRDAAITAFRSGYATCESAQVITTTK